MSGGTTGGSIGKAFIRYIRPHRWMLVLMLILTLTSSAASLTLPLMTQRILFALEDGDSLTAPLGILSALMVGSAALTGVTIWLGNRISERVVLHLRKELIHRLIRLRVHKTDRLPPGDLNTRVTSDTRILQQAASNGLVQLADGVITTIAACALMALMDWRLFLVTFAVLVGVLLVGTLALPKISAASKAVQEQVGDIGATLERALGAARLVKSHAAEGMETQRATRAAEHAYRAGVRGGKYTALIGVLTTTAIQVSFLLVLGVGGAMVAAGTLHVATLVAFLLYLFRLAGPGIGLAASLAVIFQGLGAIPRVEAVRVMPIEDDVDSPATPRIQRAPTLRFDNLSFAYPDRGFGLDGVNLSAESGRVTAIVGPSGAGKTTLFALAERFYEPDAGRILLDGVDIATVSRAELRRRIAYVEQDAVLLDGTLWENLTYGMAGVSDEEVGQVLVAAGLADFVDALPDRLATDVGTKGTMLSGGQRQRVAIARALLRKPDVLLLDEITAQLDARNEEAMRRTVEAASNRCTVLMIAHRLSTVVSADRIVVMQNGAVRTAGRHDDLLRTDDLYRELAATQLLADGVASSAGEQRLHAWTADGAPTAVGAP